MITRLISGLLALLLAAISVFALSHQTTEYYPRVEIEAGIDLPKQTEASANANTISLAFLFEAQPTLQACEALTGNIARTSLAKCPKCIVRQLECLSPLPERYQIQLSEQALDTASGRMTNGIVVFSAASAEFSLATCQETQRQTAGSPSPVTCYAANSPRPRLISQRGEFEPQTAGRILGGVLAAVLSFGLLLFAATEISLLAVGRTQLGVFPTYLTALPRTKKRLLMLLSDSIGLTVSLWLSFAVSHSNFGFPVLSVWWLFVAAPFIAIPVFVRLGLYSAVVRYLGQQALLAILLAVTVYSAGIAAVGLAFSVASAPMSVYVLNGLFAAVLIGAPRLIARNWLLHSKLGWNRTQSTRKFVAIYGAGSAGVQLASALANSREMKVVAFFDDDVQIQGRQIAGVTAYAPDQLVTIVRDKKISDVLLAIPSVSRQRRKEIIQQLERQPLRVLTLPGLVDLADGKVQVTDLREVELTDLLGRDTVAPHPELLSRNIEGKVVMVTGAGGSIGAELCRQICALGAVKLVLYEISEFNLYAIEQELLQLPEHPHIIPILGSVQDQPRLERVMRSFAVATVFHAAAYKHVPMVEKNPVQGVLNNIFGTWHASNAAVNCGVETFVLISTDKAVRPTNTMGTTKRFAEMILQAMQAHHGDGTRFTMVRFGNVLGSSGSVIPLFRQQIKDGGPITVTDPRIIRYFMTIPEAAELVIQSGAMGTGGDVFVLDMGEPVKILDLAHRMIRLSGLSLLDADHPNGDIEIQFTGLRPGEKLYEELLIGDNVSTTDHPRVQRAAEEMPTWETLQLLLENLKIACELNETARIRDLLVEGVREFEPQCGDEDLLAVKKHQA